MFLAWQIFCQGKVFTCKMLGSPWPVTWMSTLSWCASATKVPPAAKDWGGFSLRAVTDLYGGRGSQGSVRIAHRGVQVEVSERLHLLNKFRCGDAECVQTAPQMLFIAKYSYKW